MRMRNNRVMDRRPDVPVGTSAAAERVVFGPAGVLEGMAPGKGYVDMSTVDEGTSRSIAAAVTDPSGVAAVDPVPAQPWTANTARTSEQSMQRFMKPPARPRARHGVRGDGRRMHPRLQFLLRLAKRLHLRLDKPVALLLLEFLPL